MNIETVLDRVRTSRASYGWAAVAVVFLSMALAIGGGQYAFGVFVEPLEAEFGWTRTQVNASLSFSAIAGLSAPLVGRLMDRYGSRPVVTISLAMMTASFLLRPFITELWHLYALSAIQFAGFPGGAMLPGARLVGIWFPKTRGRMMGVTTMGANFGGVTMPALTGLIVGVASWQLGYAVLGALAGLIGIAGVLLIRERAPDREEGGTAGESFGRTAPSQGGSQREAVSGTTVKEALRSGSFYGITLGILAATFTYQAVLTQIVPHLQNEGLPLNRAASFLSLVAVFGMSGKLVYGYLTERFLAKNVLTLSLGVQSVGLIAMITLPGTPYLWLALPLYGMALGGMGAVFPLLVQDSFGLKAFGTIFGFVNMATIGSSLFGPLMVGMIFDATGSYGPAFLAVIGIYAAGSVGLRLAQPTFRRQQAAGERARAERV